MRIKAQRKLLDRLSEIHEASTLESARFDQLHWHGPYPTKESEVDAWIKDRIRLYMKTWIQSPLEALIETEKGDEVKNENMVKAEHDAQFCVEDLREMQKQAPPVVELNVRLLLQQAVTLRDRISALRQAMEADSA